MKESKMKNDRTVKLVDKSASLQYVTSAFGRCIRDSRWMVFGQIIETSSSADSIFFGCLCLCLCVIVQT